MKAMEIGQKMVELCKAGKNMECVETFYDQNIESIEAVAPQEGERIAKGIEAVKGKNQWWQENHEIHSHKVEGPWPHGEEKFAVRFSYDITNKPSGQRMQLDEIAVFTVNEQEKISREEFFYTM